MAKSTFRRSAVIISIICTLGVVFSAALLEATGGTADHVVGQIDFTKNVANFVDGRGLNFPSAVAIDPVGGEVYVADTDNNRVLGWKSASEFQGNQPADIVIGQPDFNSYYCNQTVGALSPGTSTPAQNTLCTPEGVAVDDSGKVYVSDTGNNRVLVYTNPFASLPGQDSDFNAIVVFGQGSSGTSFTTDSAATGQTGLSDPSGLAIDGSGNLFVLDRQNNRVLEYFDPFNPSDPTAGAGDVVADRVFGQTDFSGNLQNQGGSATGKTLDTAPYGGPAGVAIDGHGNLYVSDYGNGRVVEYNGPFDSAANDPAANLIFSGFNPFSVGGVAVDSSNTLYISATDSGGNRIFQYEETNNPPSNTTANLVFGPSMNIAAEPRASLGSELGLETDGAGNLYLADFYENRVLEYFVPGPAGGSSPGAAGDTVPDRVLGQADFDDGGANFVDEHGLSAPGDVAIDLSASPNHVYILDAGNSRVLGWYSLSELINNQAADLVVGQKSFNRSGPFTSTSCNQGSGTPSAQSLCFEGGSPGIAVDEHGNLFVADSNNNRVLEFTDPFASFQLIGKKSNFSAIAVFGQNGSFTTNECNLGGSPTASSLCDPTGVAFDPSGNLYVADAGNSRVLEFAPDTSGSFGPTPTPTALFGQGSYTQQVCANGTANGPGPSPKPTPGPDNLCGNDGNGAPQLGVTTDTSGNLYIADSYNNRVLEFTSPPNINGSANLVFGQGASGGDFNANVCSSGTDTSMCFPTGLTTDPAGNVYVADTSNGRILEYDETTQPPSNATANNIIGSRSCATFSSATTLCMPDAVALDPASRLYISDAGDNRVLEFDSPPLGPTPSATPTGTPSPTPSPTPTPAPSSTPTATPSPIPTPVGKWLHFGPNPVIFSNTVFGVTGATSAPVQVHLKNPDTPSKKSITLEGMKFVGLDAGDFAVASSTCPEVIPDGSKCFVSLTFTPSALGLRKARLKVFDNAGNAPQVFHLEGYGVRGKLERSTKAIYFGHVLKDQVSSAHDLILTNPNTVPLKIGKVDVFTTSTAQVNQFAKVADGCAETQLAAGAQCTISVTFNPKHRGKITGDIRIHDDARHRPQNVYLQGTGE